MDQQTALEGSKVRGCKAPPLLCTALGLTAPPKTPGGPTVSFALGGRTYSLPLRAASAVLADAALPEALVADCCVEHVLRLASTSEQTYVRISGPRGQCRLSGAAWQRAMRQHCYVIHSLLSCNHHHRGSAGCGPGGFGRPSYKDLASVRGALPLPVRVDPTNVPWCILAVATIRADGLPDLHGAMRL